MIKEHGSEQWSAVPRKAILGVDVCDLSAARARALLYADIEAGRYRQVAFLNAHSANVAVDDSAFHRVLERFTVLTDGIGVDLAAKLLYGQMFEANLNGTDFVPALIANAPRPLKIGLFGARPGVAERAIATLATHDDRHDYRVLAHGYVGRDEQAAMCQSLSVWKADIVLVGLGVPLQEKWIAENLTGDHATLAFGVGALFDFLAGETSRAPSWMRSARLEWVHRLIAEPVRLGQRYLVGNPVFLARAVRQKLLGRSDGERQALT